jgi:hypothetical protein
MAQDGQGTLGGGVMAHDGGRPSAANVVNPCGYRSETGLCGLGLLTAGVLPWPSLSCLCGRWPRVCCSLVVVAWGAWGGPGGS